MSTAVEEIIKSVDTTIALRFLEGVIFKGVERPEFFRNSQKFFLSFFKKVLKFFFDVPIRLLRGVCMGFFLSFIAVRKGMGFVSLPFPPCAGAYHFWR